MKANTLKFFTLYLFLLQFFIPATTYGVTNSSLQTPDPQKTSKVNINQEFENCIFLEKQLLPQTIHTTFLQKTAKLFIQAGIPLATAYLASKLTSRYILKKQKSPLRKKITASLFLITAIIFYLLTRYITQPKEITNLERLENFIKNWQQHKTATPEKFCEKFENLYILYQKQKNLNITQDEADRIVKKIIMEAIDYKIYLQYKQHDF
jgi:hypothetical protein